MQGNKNIREHRENLASYRINLICERLLASSRRFFMPSAINQDDLGYEKE